MKTFKNLTLAIVLCSIISGCSGSPMSEVKRSAGNKLFDMSGFQSNKRRPLYNKKYITKARQNVARGDYEDEEFENDEDLDIPSSSKNISMYKNMSRKDNGRRRPYVRSIYDDNDNDIDDDYDLIRSRKKLNSYHDSRSQEDLEMEILEIKDILKKTRNEIAKAKCPYNNSDSKGSGSDYDTELESKPIKKKKIIKIQPGAMTQVKD